MRIIRMLPKNAKYDCEDMFGDKHYHSDRRIYVVNSNYITSYSRKEVLNNEIPSS